MLNIYLCDDDVFFLLHYREVIESLSKKHSIPIVLHSFNSGDQLVFHLLDNPNDADIIYLDILMKGLNGIETGRKLRQMGCHSEIIFLTSSEEFVFESFDAEPLNYLIKGVSDGEKFEDIFLRAIKLSTKKSSEMFSCKSSSVQKQIPISSITHFEVRSRVITVHYGDVSFDFYSTMSTLEQRLAKKNFARCHRSFLVNLHYVNEITPTEVCLRTGNKLPIGTTYAKLLRQAFASYTRAYHPLKA